MTPDAPLRNRILRALPTDDLRHLLPCCRREQLVVGQVIEPSGTRATKVVFPLSGVASVVAAGDRGKKLETGPIGWEGMTGLALVLDVDHSPTETVVQVAGEAIVAPSDEIARLINTSEDARAIFARYTYAFGLQVVETALAAGFASVEKRLARWILMLHDRIEGDEILVTHEFIGMMLGTRRPGVTVATHLLEGKGLIKGERGRLLIRNREGLKNLCGAIYGVPEKEYNRVLGQFPEALSEDEKATAVER